MLDLTEGVLTWEGVDERLVNFSDDGLRWLDEFLADAIRLEHQAVAALDQKAAWVIASAVGVAGLAIHRMGLAPAPAPPALAALILSALGSAVAVAFAYAGYAVRSGWPAIPDDVLFAKAEVEGEPTLGTPSCPRYRILVRHLYCREFTACRRASSRRVRMAQGFLAASAIAMALSSLGSVLNFGPAS